MSANTVIKQLPNAWKFGKHEVTEVELRVPTLADLIESENEGGNPYRSPTAYKVALAARTIVRAGDYTGPIAPAQLKSMHPVCWYAISAALNEAETLGEDELPTQAQKA